MNTSVLPIAVLHTLFSAYTQEQRDLFMKAPMTAAILPYLDKSRKALAAASSVEGKERALRRLKTRAAVADQVHDQEATLLYQVLTAAASLARRDAEKADFDVESIEGIIDTLFPDGLSQINKSHLQEASEAVLNYRALTRRQLDLLARITFQGLTALSIARRWVAAAEKLGDIVRQRAVLAESFGLADELNVQSVRSTALSRLRLLFDMLGESGLDAASVSAIRGPANAAVQEHLKRLARQGAAAGEAETGDAEDALDGGVDGHPGGVIPEGPRSMPSAGEEQLTA